MLGFKTKLAGARRARERGVKRGIVTGGVVGAVTKRAKERRASDAGRSGRPDVKGRGSGGFIGRDKERWNVKRVEYLAFSEPEQRKDRQMQKARVCSSTKGNSSGENTRPMKGKIPLRGASKFFRKGRRLV